MNYKKKLKVNKRKGILVGDVAMRYIDSLESTIEMEILKGIRRRRVKKRYMPRERCVEKR